MEPPAAGRRRPRQAALITGITTPRSGLSDTGVLFRKGDIVDLATETLRMAADPGLRHAIGLRARRMTEGRSIDAAVARYEAAFLDVASGIPPRPEGGNGSWPML